MADATAQRKLPGSLETNRNLSQWLDINADGTYSMTSSEGEQAGSWVENDQGVCMTGSEEGAAESCYTISDADAEGVRTITGADGNGVRYSFAAE